MYEENEVSIDLLDICAYVLHKWRKICIWMVAFMLVIGGIMSLRNYMEIQNKYADETYAEMIKDMTEAQINNVQQFYNSYKTYRERITENQFYLDHSLKMKIDPNIVSTYTVEYMVKTDYQNIMGSLSSSMLDMGDYNRMASVVGNDVDPRFVRELVSIGGGVDGGVYDIDTDKVGDIINGTISYTYTGILYVSTVSNDRQICENLAQIVNDALMEYIDKLHETGMAVEVSMIDATYTETVDMALAEYQRSQIDSGARLVTDFYNVEEDAKKSLDEDEQKVFGYLIQKEQNVKDHVQYAKWVVLGGAVGFFAALMVVIIGYFAIPGIKTISDANTLTGTKEFGIIIQPTTSRLRIGKVFHRFAKRLEFRTMHRLGDIEAMRMICEHIAQRCAKINASSVFIASDSEMEYCHAVLPELLRVLKEYGIEASYGNPETSIEAINTLRLSDAVVYAITIKDTLSESIESFNLIAEESETPIIGNFIIYPQN